MLAKHNLIRRSRCSQGVGLRWTVSLFQLQFGDLDLECISTKGKHLTLRNPLRQISIAHLFFTFSIPVSSIFAILWKDLLVRIWIRCGWIGRRGKRAVRYWFCVQRRHYIGGSRRTRRCSNVLQFLRLTMMLLVLAMWGALARRVSLATITPSSSGWRLTRFTSTSGVAYEETRLLLAYSTKRRGCKRRITWSGMTRGAIGRGGWFTSTFTTWRYLTVHCEAGWQ